MKQYMYSEELSVQILLSLLKAHGIKKIIASPGAQNFSLLCSMKYDGEFEMYSCVDERSAAYMACGMAEATGEPVVITCTGATASRNYMPALTEAYYRKLPVIAVTCTKGSMYGGHLIPQQIDRTSSRPNDICKVSVDVQYVYDEASKWSAEVLINNALLEAKRHGGGSIHINLTVTDQRKCGAANLHQARVIRRFMPSDKLPKLPEGKIAIFCATNRLNEKDFTAIDVFCKATGAVVLCEQDANYQGHNRFLGSLVGSNLYGIGTKDKELAPDLLIYIGEVAGSYALPKIWLKTKEMWRVSEDGEIRDTFKILTNIFEMTPSTFFEAYSSHTESKDCINYFKALCDYDSMLRSNIPELPFSNTWIASTTANKLPGESHLFLAVLHSKRSWNLFPTTASKCSMNSGGFGIDGCLSTCVGSSVALPNILHFCVIGDLAFFYDMNILGNRHIGNNLRILLINNNAGVEFHLKTHPASMLGTDGANEFTAAGGHFVNHFGGEGKESSAKAWAESLGFAYLTASNKEEYLEKLSDFTSKLSDKPVLYEVFTRTEDDALAEDIVEKLDNHAFVGTAKSIARLLPPDVRQGIKKITGLDRIK
jgi:2-succinyl-5-enolpyruvyl-6-hydroxy-3-cyclohexene-1-carboxylate synthase